MRAPPAALAGPLARILARAAAPVAVALSGGADSAALLVAAAAVARGAGHAGGLRALHVNHGLGAHAAELEAAARLAAARAGVALEVLAVTVDGEGGVEAAARTARYRAFAHALRPGETLLLAHHLEDQAETLLLQLVRGAGPRGLASMPPSAPLGPGVLCRPWLAVSRAAIRRYAREADCAFADDPMNGDPRFDRAYLRAEVWPPLLARWPAAARTLARSARHLAAAEAVLAEEAQRWLAPLRRDAALELGGLARLDATRQALVLRAWIGGEGVRMPPAQWLERVAREAGAARPGSSPSWRHGELRLRLFQGLLYALEATAPALPAEGPLPAAGAAVALEAGGSLACRRGLGGLAPDPATPYRVGPRLGGERLRLHAGGHRRPLKDLLREAQLPPWARERVLVVHSDSVAAVVLPHATWIDAGHVAAAGTDGLWPEWRQAPATYRPLARAREVR